MLRIVYLAIIIIMLAVMAASSQALQLDIEAEKKMGQDAAAETDKGLKFITDEKSIERVQRIGQEIAEIARTTKVSATYGSDLLADFKYSFKLVDDYDINAASLPGGYIYINKGLLDRVESDDELAGVIAHEVAHTAHHHMYYLLKKQSQYDRAVFAIFAAAVLGKASATDMQNVFYGAKLFELAKLNAYSQEAEMDADTTAINYLVKTKYNPVGLLTFMEKLARDHAYNPIDMGIFQTHPLSRERADNIIEQIKKHGIPINRRAVSSSASAYVQTAEVDGKQVLEVVIDGRLVIRPADLPGINSSQRAENIAKAINQSLDKEPQIRDIKLGYNETSVYIKDSLVLDVYDADAKLATTTREALATDAKEAIQSALLSESLKLLY